jgi:hypothetical protein
MHLKADDLIDLAEGTRAEASAPHLAECAQCRAQLTELRAMMAAIADVGVPEPSPLFWDHFSRRVHDVTAAEPIVPGRSFASRLFTSRALHAALVACASLVLVVIATSRTRAPGIPAAHRYSQEQAEAAHDPFVDAPIEADPSFALVATLAENVDADLATDAALVHVGSADHAVTHMSDAELRELGRLLQEALAP